MTLLAILIALVVDRMWSTLAERRNHVWFQNMVDGVWRRFGSMRWMHGPVGVLLLLAPVVLVVALVYAWLAQTLDLLAFLFAALVLIFTLGPGDLDGQLRRFLDAWEWDEQDNARAAALEIHRGPDPATPGALARAVIEAALVEVHGRLFAVLFWFVLLGPIGAVLYRLASLLNEHAERQLKGEIAETTRVFLGVLDWIPARITVLGYALTGNFGDALHGWRESANNWAHDWVSGTRQVLLAGGMGALQFDPVPSEEDEDMGSTQVRATQALLWRTLILAVSIVALLTLAGWFG